MCPSFFFELLQLDEKTTHLKQSCPVCGGDVVFDLFFYSSITACRMADGHILWVEASVHLR